MSERTIPNWKIQIVEQLESLMKEYQVIAAAELSKVRSSQIHEMRKRLRDKVKMLVVKKTLIQKAAEKVEDKKKGINSWLETIEGPSMLLFTNIDPFQLLLTLNKSKVKVEAKGGDIATGDIIIPAGNTGIPPGPVISEFGEVKVPTKIESGSIWIANDTVVAQKDDQITSKLASLLSRLGIKPMEVGLSLFSAYENEVIFDKHSLVIDVKDIEDKLKEAIIQALNLSVNAHIPTKDALPLIISKAYHEAYTLAVAVSYPTDETTSALLNKAHIHALTLQNKIST